MDFNQVAYDFLHSCKIPISKSYLSERLQSHPEYPSLKSLTDLLDEFGLENKVLYVSEKNRWRELNFPFLCFMHTDEGSNFQIITNPKSLNSEAVFLKRWSGIVLLIDKQSKIVHPEHDLRLREEKNSKMLLWLFLIAITSLLFTRQLFQFELNLFIHFVLSVAGLIVSCSIIGYSMGLKSNVSELFCKIEESGCNKVLNSKLGRFNNHVGLGDFAAVFFASWLFYLSFSNQFEFQTNLRLLLIVYLFAFSFTLFSLAYQLYLKSLCKLCLILVLIIWSQSFNIAFSSREAYGLSLYDISLPLNACLTYAIGFSLLCSWFIIKPFINNYRIQFEDKIKIRKWRQDPRWFDALLPLHKKIDDVVWRKEIFYGNQTGVLQIIIVSDPYCNFCAEAHKELNNILEKHPNDIGVRIRFTLKSLDIKNKSYQAALSILKTYEDLVWQIPSEDPNIFMRKIIDFWFANQNLLIFNKKFKLDADDSELIESLIEKSKIWADSMEVVQTPAFFINGNEMPNPHNFKDLFLFISEYIDILKEKNTI